MGRPTPDGISPKITGGVLPQCGEGDKAQVDEEYPPRHGLPVNAVDHVPDDPRRNNSDDGRQK